MDQLKCVVVTPEATVLEETTPFVVVPLFDGEIGIALGHSPMIGRLGYGELRLTLGDQTARYYVDGGFVQVADNVVSVITGRAVPAAEIDADVAQEHLQEAFRRPANSPELMEVRDRIVAQARAQLRLARRSAESTA